MSADRQQERSGIMDVLGRPRTTRGWFVKAALARQSALKGVG